MQFYFRQFSGDESVASMDLDAVGAHILLMCYAGASKHLYKIEFSDEKLRRILRGVSDENWVRIKQQLLCAWEVSEDGKWLVQNGMKRSLAKRKAFCDKQRERATTRWANVKSVPEVYRNDTGSVPKTCSASASASASANIYTPNGVYTPIPPKTRISKTKEPIEIIYPQSWSESHIQTFKRWMEYRTQIRKPLKAMSYQAQLQKFSDNPDQLAKLINRAIEKAWQGLNEEIPFEYKPSFVDNEKSRVEKNLEFAKSYLKELEDEEKNSH